MSDYDSNRHIKYNCEWCEKETFIVKSHFNRVKHHFCSPKCNALYYGNKRIKSKNKCIICGENKPHKNNLCKVCLYKSNYNFTYNDKWTEKVIYIILDNVLYKKIKYLNELENILKIPLKEILEYMTKTLCVLTSLRIKKYCLQCGNKFTLPPNRVISGKDKFCSSECSQLSKKERFIYNCDYCGEEIERTKSQYEKSKNHFCSNKCADKFKQEKHTVEKVCIICEEKFKIRKSLEHQMCCSIQCQGVWQSKNLVGENANNWKSEVPLEDRRFNCDWCNKETIVRPYNIKNKNHFCSHDCLREWLTKYFVNTEANIDRQRKLAVKILEDGLIEKVNSEPQVIINNLLNELNIMHKNEKGFKYYTVDNYLIDYNLIIEVMGIYWHCDHRFYPSINYSQQVHRIKIDKAKHTYIKNNYNIEILYLWEYDILNNIKLCEELIKLYIKNKGILENYHSFNYTYQNNNLFLNKDIIIPYMNYDKKDLNKIINIKTKQNMSKKQLDKWIFFNCEQCGNEKEQLKSRYNKAKHHFCSHNCTLIYLHNNKKSS